MSEDLAQAGRPGYYVWIVTPPNYGHSRAFEEVALALAEAFAELGFLAPVVTDPTGMQGCAIVLGANLLPDYPGPLPARMVLYNFEQVQQGSAWMRPAYIELLRRHPVWDYSALNIHALAGMGVQASLCGVGYTPGLTRIQHAMMQDIDVVFIGVINERRAFALNQLQGVGMKVYAAAGLYGAERDALYARAKIVLNLHHYDAQVFEVVRVSYLLANRLCVVSEIGFDEVLERPFRDGAGFTNFSQLTMGCRYLMQNPAERRRLANKGYEIFSGMPQAPMLARALEAIGERVLAS